MGIECGIVLVECIKPYEIVSDFLSKLNLNDTHIVYVEEGIKNGGAAMITGSMLAERDMLKNNRFEIAAIEDFANPDTACDLYDSVGLSVAKLSAYFKQQRS